MNLHDYLKKNGITQKHIMKLANVSKVTMGRIKKGLGVTQETADAILLHIKEPIDLIITNNHRRGKRPKGNE